MIKLFTQPTNYIKFWLLLTAISWSFLINERATAQEFVIHNSTITVTANEDPTHDGNAFYIWDDMSNYPPDWTAPYDYKNGTIYVRYEIINQPEIPGQPGTYRSSKLQFCIWGKPHNTGEAIMDEVFMNGKGAIGTASSSPAQWFYKKDPQGVAYPLDFSNAADFWKVGIAVWDGTTYCIPSTWEVGTPQECFFAPNYQDYFFPLEVKLTVVAVAQGGTFSGWAKYISAPQPLFSVDFSAEKTKEIVPNTYDYSTSTSGPWTIGANLAINLTPGQDMYFHKIGDPYTTYVTLDVPSRPSTPAVAINYYDETTDIAITPGFEYSLTADFAETFVGTGSKPGVTPGVNAYFRYRATVNSFKSGVQLLVVPNQPAAPSYGFDYLSGLTTETVSSLVEYSTNYNMSGAVSGTGDFVTVIPGTSMYFRTKATDLTFASAKFELPLSARPAAPVIGIDYDNVRTTALVTSSMEYSPNLSFTPTTTGSGSYLTLTPGVNVYIRTKSTASSFASQTASLIVPARPTSPAYLVDYVAETTNLEVPATDEYASAVDGSNNLIGAVSGTNLKLPLTPGSSPKNLYIRTKTGANSFASLPTHLTIPARPAITAYEINFATVQTKTAVAATDEYSVNSNMTGATPGTGVQIAVNPGSSLYFRKKALAGTSFASEIQPLVIPARPLVPAYEIDYANETTKANVLSTDQHSTSALMTSPVDGANTKLTLTPGTNVYFRTKSTLTSFESLVQTLTVPVRPVKPSYDINYVAETTDIPVSINDEYSTDPLMVSPVATDGANVAVAVTPGNSLYLRKKATSNSFHSDNFVLTAAVRPATPSYSIDFANITTIENVPATVEYDSNASFNNPVIGNGTKVTLTPGNTLNFRIKSTATTFKSAAFSLPIPARPAAPNYSIDYITEKTSSNIPNTVEFAENSNFTSASSGNGSQIQVIPGTNLYFRVKGTSSSFASTSLLLPVPARPAAPTQTIDFVGETTSAVVDNTDEYSTSTTFSPSTLGSGVKVAVTPATDLYIRKKASNTSFYGVSQHLVVPQRPVITSALSDTTSLATIDLNIAFSPAVTGFDGGDITLTNALFKSLVGNYTVQVSPVSTGDVKVNINANVVTGGNFKANQFKIYYRKGLGINNRYELKGVTLFPNPSNGSVTVNTSNLKGNIDVKISNLQGKVLLEKALVSDSETIDLSSLPKGIYVVMISNNGMSSVDKLILQ